MKNIFKTIIVFMLCLLTNKVSAQLDTLNYLKQFETNKINYINKPFSYLLSQMTQIQPKTVWFDYNIKNKNIVQRSIFKFCEMDYSFKNAIFFEITWQQEIPFNQVKYYYDRNHFYFTNEEWIY